MLRSLAVLFEDFIISLVHTTQHSPACRLAFGRKVRDPRAQHLLRRHHEFPLRHPKRRQNIAWKDHDVKPYPLPQTWFKGARLGGRVRWSDRVNVSSMTHMLAHAARSTDLETKYLSLPPAPAHVI